MTLNLKKKVTLTASQMLAENNRATADRLTWAAQTDEMNLRTALNVPESSAAEAAIFCQRSSFLASERSSGRETQRALGNATDCRGFLGLIYG